MTGCGKRENQEQVSLFSHRPWKSQKARFPHSHSPGDYREEKWKSKSRIPLSHRGFLPLQNLKKEDSPERRLPVVQAHRSIRICWVKMSKMSNCSTIYSFQKSFLEIDFHPI